MTWDWRVTSLRLEKVIWDWEDCFGTRLVWDWGGLLGGLLIMG